MDHTSLSSTSIASILQYYHLATEFDRQWYKAWHAWAFMNFQALLQQRQVLKQEPKPQQKVQFAGPGNIGDTSPPSSSSSVNAPLEPLQETDMSVAVLYASNAVQGFFRSISLSSGNSLQDTLRYSIHPSIYLSIH